MNFKKLIEDDCNRVNPIVQLAAYVTHDHTERESIGLPFASNQMEENSMVPQSFNMNEIMTQIQGVESQNAAIQSPRDDAHIWLANYDNQIMQDPFVQHRQNEVLGNFLPIEEQHFGQSLNVPLFAPVYLPPGVEFFPNTFEELNSLPPQPLELLFAAKEPEEHEQDVEESFSTISKSQDNVSKETAYLHYGGLSVEDVNGTTDLLGVEFTEPEQFYNFVKNYVIKYNGQKYKKCKPRSISTVEYEFYAVVQSPSIRTASRVLCNSLDEDVNGGSFRMPYNNDPNKDLIKKLCEGLVINEHYLDAIRVLEENFSSFKEDDYLYIFLLADLYLHEHSFYQACQILFIWLKNDPDYMDIVPPNFSMEHKDDGAIEKKTLDDLIKMFIKAAQRCPINPDFRIQMALAKLCQVDRDYEKSVDCMLSVLNKKEFGQVNDQFLYLLRCLSNNFSLCNKPYHALSVLPPVNDRNLDNIDVQTQKGLICLYQKCYELAFTYFLGVVTRLVHHGYEECKDNLLVNSWTRLRLCVELMGRDDLCNAVDQRNLSALRRSNISTEA